MSSATKTMEQMKILQDMGNGLLNRLYFLKGNMIAKRKPGCLTDADTSKVRVKIEKKFPSMPEAQKVRQILVG